MHYILELNKLAYLHLKSPKKKNVIVQHLKNEMSSN